MTSAAHVNDAKGFDTFLEDPNLSSSGELETTNSIFVLQSEPLSSILDSCDNAQIDSADALYVGNICHGIGKLCDVYFACGSAKDPIPDRSLQCRRSVLLFHDATQCIIPRQLEAPLGHGLRPG
jgi:hypothetical protein